MGAAANRLEHAWLAAVLLISLSAWSASAIGGSGFMFPAFCSSGPLWSLPLWASFKLALAFNPPAMLARDWALMIAGMMSPLMIAPLRHVRDRSFAKRGARAMLLFAAGYMAAWMIAGAALLALAFAARWLAPTPLVCFALAFVTAMFWQVSPAKQWFLNRCHRKPHLAAFGSAADRDALGFGVTNGASCVGACWALMLLSLLIGYGHMLGMIVVAIFAFAERLERPAELSWRWRAPNKAVRIAIAQMRMRLAPPNWNQEALQ